MALDSMDITSTVQHQFIMSGVNMNLKPPKPATNTRAHTWTGRMMDGTVDGKWDIIFRMCTFE